MTTRSIFLFPFLVFASSACGVDGTPPIGPAGQAGGSEDDAGGVTGGGNRDAGSGASSDAGGAGSGDAGGGGDAGTPCFADTYHPGVSIDDLKQAYTSGAWLTTSLEVMSRRYPTGHFVLDGEKTDPQLAGFSDSSSWSALMESLMTMVHEESHGYDFDHSQAGSHLFVLRDNDLLVQPPELANMWPRSELLSMITDDSTKLYDDTYLTGTQGTYDVVFLGEELNAYTNGLAAITAVADQITSTISARDGVVAHLLYLELYLKRGRAAHPTEYAAMKAEPAWQKFVRFEWARGHYWDKEALPFPVLTIGADRIWPHVNDAANLEEIKQFTGDDAAYVACHP